MYQRGNTVRSRRYRVKSFHEKDAIPVSQHEVEKCLRSQSAIDIRVVQDDYSSTSSTMTTNPAPQHKSLRKRFFPSFRSKIKKALLQSSSKDKSESSLSSTEQSPQHVSESFQRMSLSASQPEMFHPFSSLHNSLDKDDVITHYSQTETNVTISPATSQECSFSDQSLTPPLKLPQKETKKVEMEPEREEEEDSGIAVLDTSVIVQESTAISSQQYVLMQNPFHQLEVWLQEGCDLVIRDSCGTSDPYVKFKIGNRQYYKSRTILKNLNPKWDEKFMIPIDDVLQPVQVRVFDYDRGMTDDPMGSAEIDLTSLELNTSTDLKLLLTDKKFPDEYMGYLKLQVRLLPKSQEEKENYYKKSVRVPQCESATRKVKTQIWSGVVTIVLLEGHDLIPMDDNGLSDPYVRFRLGNEKYKSKFKSKTLNPKWLEQFDLRMYEGQTSHLEITLYDHDVGRDDFMGRAEIDLSQLECEKTHMIEQPLEDSAGFIKLLLTISGTTGSETISDLQNLCFTQQERNQIIKKYGLTKMFHNLKDVGWLQVKVYKAQGLMAADIGGKSDPFCVLELVNSRLQTQTEYKTLNPEWNKVFTFNVKDIHSVLEVTVYDEDRDRKVEFLGRVSIPLLKIQSGERRWYALKDRKLLHKTKGSIQLEMDFIFNHVKAAVRTVNPKEEKYMQPDPRFKISTMKKNIDRVSQLISTFMDTGRFIQSCFQWESKYRSITAFILSPTANCTDPDLPSHIALADLGLFCMIRVINGTSKMDPECDTSIHPMRSSLADDLSSVRELGTFKTKYWSPDGTALYPYSIIFLIMVWNFELYMLPITLLIIFLRNLFVASVLGAFSKEPVEDKYVDEEDDEEDDEKDKDEKKGLREKFHAIQEICLQVQKALDVIASLGERVKNTFNWSVPWLSTLAVIALSVGTIILYYIPVRYLILAWGINKFTKKLRAPNAIPNNELLDFLSRIPSDSELIMYRELRPDINTVSSKKKKS